MITNDFYTGGRLSVLTARDIIELFPVNTVAQHKCTQPPATVEQV